MEPRYSDTSGGKRHLPAMTRPAKTHTHTHPPMEGIIHQPVSEIRSAPCARVLTTLWCLYIRVSHTYRSLLRSVSGVTRPFSVRRLSYAREIHEGRGGGGSIDRSIETSLLVLLSFVLLYCPPCAVLLYRVIFARDIYHRQGGSYLKPQKIPKDSVFFVDISRYFNASINQTRS